MIKRGQWYRFKNEKDKLEFLREVMCENIHFYRTKSLLCLNKERLLFRTQDYSPLCEAAQVAVYYEPNKTSCMILIENKKKKLLNEVQEKTREEILLCSETLGERFIKSIEERRRQQSLAIKEKFFELEELYKITETYEQKKILLKEYGII